MKPLKMERLLIIFVEILTTFVVGIWTECPENCSCVLDRVNCIDSGHTYIPSVLPNGTKSLSMYGNNLSHESSLANLEYLTSIEELDLSFCSIETIPVGLLQKMAHLEVLYLTGNAIKELKSGMFSKLDLKKLELNNNTKLHKLDSGAFINSSIRSLSMDHSSISFIESSTLKPLMGSLNTLSISYNKVALSLSDNLLTGFKLEQGLFTESGIKTHSFLYNSSVDTLDLSHNPIGNNVWNILAHTQVKELYVISTGCTLINIQPEQRNLTSLITSSNKIGSNINGSSFQKAPNLSFLMINNCSIQYLPEYFGSNVRKLKYLDLSSNELKYLEPSWFRESNLEILDLSNNEIQSFERSVVEALPPLKVLKMVNNPIHCNCDMLWFSNWLLSIENSGVNVFTGDCHTPEAYKGKPVSSLETSQFTCDKPIIVFIISKVIEPGRPFEVYCKAKGDPKPRVSISLPDDTTVLAPYNDSNDEQEVEVHQIVPTYNCSLKGIYTCTAVNIAGTFVETINISHNCERDENTNYEHIVKPVVTVEIDWDSENGDTLMSSTTDAFTVSQRPNITDVNLKESTQSIQVRYLITIVILLFMFLTLTVICVYLLLKLRVNNVKEQNSKMEPKENPLVYFIRPTDRSLRTIESST